MNANLLFDFNVDRENKTVYVVREFNAGLDLVWQAWTTPELLDQWWAPKPMISRTKVMNFEVGGRRFFAMVGPDGQEGWMVQKYTSITPKTNFKTYNAFSDKDENLELPGSEWDMTFSELNGITKVNITITNESRERFDRIVDGFSTGFTMGLDQLAEVLSAITNK